MSTNNQEEILRKILEILSDDKWRNEFCDTCGYKDMVVDRHGNTNCRNTGARMNIKDDACPSYTPKERPIEEPPEENVASYSSILSSLIGGLHG